MTRAIFILSLLYAASALAVPIDPASDHIGVYFDADATITNIDSSANIPFTAHVIITNPTIANIQGFELGYQFVVPPGFEDSYELLGDSLPPQPVDVGLKYNLSQGDYIVGLGSPLPHSTAVIIVTWDLVLTEDFPMDIFLGPVLPQSIDDGLPAHCTVDSVFSLGLSSGNVAVAVATVNGGVSDVPRQFPPNTVVLEQCQPNPFNPRTTIKYSLAREGLVTLLVHDISGRTVRVLLDGQMVGRGGHEVIWDGLDSAGKETASGVYFYQIKALGTTATKRMTLVR